MKIGDLVKYDKSLNGLHNCMGIIVGCNGGAVDVLWLDEHALPSGRPSHPEKSAELPEFLEVVSENGN
tara:strand:- start:697 stop:900 length:204 start_codon:yes stop_codon:yes gene_type:complete